MSVNRTVASVRADVDVTDTGEELLDLDEDGVGVAEVEEVIVAR